MRKIMLSLLPLAFFLSGLSGQVMSEEDVNNRIRQARSEVDAAQSAVGSASQDLQQKTQQLQQARTDWNNLQQEIKTLQEKILSADNTLAKSVEHIDREIQRSQQQLQVLQRNHASAEEIEQAQREVTAYQNLKNNSLRRSGLTALKAGYQRLLAEKEADLERLRPILQSNIANVKQAEEQLSKAQLNLSDAQVKLADLLQQAPGLLGYINPPFLKKVSALGDHGGRYDAEWDDYEQVIDEQIDIVKKGIEEQKKIITAYKNLIEENSNQLLDQQRVTDAKLDAYVHEVQTWSWIKSSAADLIDAGLNIARNFKEMGPYAFAYEAIYRVGESLLTNTANSNWDITKLPTQPDAPLDLTGMAGNTAIAVGKDQVKGLISQALQSYIGTSPFGIPGSGIRFGTEASISGVKTGFMQLVREGRFWVVADQDLSSKWMATLTSQNFKMNSLEDLFNTLKRDPRAFLANWKSSFNKERLKGALWDLAQSSAIQAMKEMLDQKRLSLWSDYLVEDMKRTELLNNLKFFGYIRRFQMTILESLNEVLQDLIRKKEEQANQPTRYLKINTNETVNGSTCLVNLEFSGDVAVDSVLLAGKPVPGKGTKNMWTGTVDISSLQDKDLAQLLVSARGPTTQKVLDDPRTAARFAATTQTWAGYEPQNDQYHKIKLKPVRSGTSIVLLIDCSGSMNDNDKIKKAIRAAVNVLSSKQFGPNDEVAILTFNACAGASILQPFTSDFELLKQKVSSLQASGDTPLAESMKQASYYLESAAHNRYRKMIVLTDGVESCGGNEFEALSLIKRNHQEFVKLTR